LQLSRRDLNPIAPGRTIPWFVTAIAMRTTGDRVETTSRYTLRTWVGLVVLCFGAAVTLLNMAVLSPLLRAIGVEFGTSDATTGQLATLGSLVGVIASLVATPWMDRWSRRTWLRLEGSVVLVATVVSALAPSFGWLMAGRVLASCGAAVIMANCLTGTRELFRDPVWRNRAIGIIVSATTFAFILGMPLVTQIEARLGWRIAMGSMAVPVVLLLAGTFVLPPSPRHPRMTVRPHPLAAFQAVLGNGRTRCLLVVLGLNLGLYAGWLVYFGAYTIDVFAVSATVLSLLFFLSGATELVANNLTPPLMRRFDPVSILYVMLASVAAALLLTGIAVTTIPAALLVAIVVLNGTASAYIAANALLLEGEVSHPGAVMSVASAFIGIGTALGPFVAGWALANSGSFEAAYRTLGLLAPVAMVALWLGTRRRAPVPVIERA
jgi:MFS transporter, DHA1 family, inner membrane transport protein